MGPVHGKVWIVYQEPHCHGAGGGGEQGRVEEELHRPCFLLPFVNSNGQHGGLGSRQGRLTLSTLQ